jgi:hypothetical protein
VKDLKPDYKCLEKKADKVEQNKAVFDRQKVLINIFKRQNKQTKIKIKI